VTCDVTQLQSIVLPSSLLYDTIGNDALDIQVPYERLHYTYSTQSYFSPSELTQASLTTTGAHREGTKPSGFDPFPLKKNPLFHNPPLSKLMKHSAGFTMIHFCIPRVVYPLFDHLVSAQNSHALMILSHLLLKLLPVVTTLLYIGSGALERPFEPFSRVPSPALLSLSTDLMTAMLYRP
jgi:hypothetical protein